MKSIGYSFIEPSTFEIVNLRNTYSNRKPLLVDDTGREGIMYYLKYGEQMIVRREWGTWRRRV